MTLKYLFNAYFADGTLIEQTQEDRSRLDPQKSAFYDVLQKTDSVLEQFSLTGLNTLDDSYSVDLIHGRFVINGHVFSPQPVDADVIPPGGKYELIYFRDHRHTFEVGASLTETDHTVRYRFGWKYTAPGGKVWTQTLVVD